MLDQQKKPKMFYCFTRVKSRSSKFNSTIKAPEKKKKNSIKVNEISKSLLFGKRISETLTLDTNELDGP